MTENNFLAEGGYGCLFSPYISCKGKSTNDYRFISKIQIRNFYSENEIRIGKQIIKTLPIIYKNFFVPSVYNCDINIKHFANKRCSIINKCKKSPFVLLKIPYIGYKGSYISYQDYIIQDISDREIVLNIITSYKHLLNALYLLKDINICHFDLNNTNILFSQNRGIPYIIDFGLSFSVKHIEENLNNYFYVYYPQYYIWPLEVHYINFLLHINSNPSDADLKKIANTYIKNNIPLVQNFSADFLKQFETLSVQVLKAYQESTDTINDIIKKYWYTWDNYALSIMYLQIIYYLNISFHKGKNIGSFTKNPFITHFTKLLLQNIHPNPKKRLNIRDSISSFESFFYQTNINDIDNYEQIIINYTRNKNILKKIVFENKVDFQKLIKTMIKSRTVVC